MMYDQSQEQPQVIEAPAESDTLSNTISAASAPAVNPEPQSEAAAPPQEQTMSSLEQEQMRNFKVMRETANKAQRERDEALRRAEQYERMLATMTQPTQQQAPEPEEEFNIPDSDDLVDSKKLAEYARYQKKQIQELKRQNQQILSQTKNFSGESRFMAENPDWQRVMTVENIQALSDAYPSLARSVNASSDVYEKAQATYTLIKKFGIYSDTPFEADKKRALDNIAKPKPLTSISPQQGETPLSRANAFANGLTDELKMQLRKEMAAASRKY
jgi:hypothetical protein